MIAGPIGNLEDITLRAIEVLKRVSIIACEDTRQTQKLLSRYGIEKKCMSYHNFNEWQATERIISILESGESVGFLTDAGTPLISDPGFYLVRAVRKNNIIISPVPGASALSTILSVCPIPVNKFYFEGFLPTKKGRTKRIEFLSTLPETAVIFYESPYRITKLLDELLNVMGDRSIFIGREMTKKFEEFLFGNISTVIKLFESCKVQGEFVVVVEGIK